MKILLKMESASPLGWEIPASLLKDRSLFFGESSFDSNTLFLVYCTPNICSKGETCIRHVVQSNTNYFRHSVSLHHRVLPASLSSDKDRKMLWKMTYAVLLARVVTTPSIEERSFHQVASFLILWMHKLFVVFRRLLRIYLLRHQVRLFFGFFLWRNPFVQ